jgi:hypothetical protein
MAGLFAMGGKGKGCSWAVEFRDRVRLTSHHGRGLTGPEAVGTRPEKVGQSGRVSGTDCRLVVEGLGVSNPGGWSWLGESNPGLYSRLSPDSRSPLLRLEGPCPDHH